MEIWSWKREQATMPFQLQTRTSTARTLLSPPLSDLTQESEGEVASAVGVP
jgi:hypothetical protein